jgi:hypothetical protein
MKTNLDVRLGKLEATTQIVSKPPYLSFATTDALRAYTGDLAGTKVYIGISPDDWDAAVPAPSAA